MKLVLLSGGSGKRLWPLSNDSRSKQFLKVLRSPEGGVESMVQRVWRQLAYANLHQSSYIASCRSQVEMLQTQINGNVRLIIEPSRRDTFPAIALAASYLYSIASVSLEEVITILPVDPFVEDRFFETVKELESVIKAGAADIALIGVKPTFPSEKYGYIVQGAGEPVALHSGISYRTVSHFQEKPSQELAEALIAQGALWNCGVFAFKLDYLINLLIQKELPIRYEELVNKYDQLAKISFDYEVVEKAERVTAVSYNGTWKDLGTWNTLTEEIASPVLGKGIISEDSVNTHLINELDIPVTVLGLSNVVIATSPDGILVTEKCASPRIKDVMKDINIRPMYEERRWGHYRVIDFSSCGIEYEVLTKRTCVTAGNNMSYHMHTRRSEVWTVITGEGEFVMNEKFIPIKAGDVLQIPCGAKHSIRAFTNLELIEVQYGPVLTEDDTVRLTMDWKDIMEFAIRE
ncbi:sugar phosphate nucleotidyltransferase [Paenibacillus sp. Soil522]|uniref:sugar phosphate nucleotidyltransferase n=1 Tax=Paenibacillus sp. Soil522 TaxID=1736388 RepID=UPI0006FBA2D4|nr:sugar phosphate nucleotidyltransferase [Paenibacillus sp. Soil522]KRE51258.1 mannose-1-phosphate guanylyltransferase [Paenibacillus sp. Soil522]